MGRHRPAWQELRGSHSGARMGQRSVVEASRHIARSRCDPRSLSLRVRGSCGRVGARLGLPPSLRRAIALRDDEYDPMSSVQATHGWGRLSAAIPRGARVRRGLRCVGACWRRRFVILCGRTAASMASRRRISRRPLRRLWCASASGRFLPSGGGSAPLGTKAGHSGGSAPPFGAPPHSG